MKLEEAYMLAHHTHSLGRNAWIKNGKISNLISCDKTLEEIKSNSELTDSSLNADDWSIWTVI